MQSAVDREILKPSWILDISTSVCNFRTVTIKILGSRGKSSSGNTTFSSNFNHILLLPGLYNMRIALHEFEDRSSSSLSLSVS